MPVNGHCKLDRNHFSFRFFSLDYLLVSNRMKFKCNVLKQSNNSNNKLASIFDIYKNKRIGIVDIRDCAHKNSKTPFALTVRNVFTLWKCKTITLMNLIIKANQHIKLVRA